MWYVLPVPVAVLPALEAGWVGPVGAISLVVIALSFLVIAATVAFIGRGILETLRALRETAAEGRGLVTRLKEEVDEVVRTSQRVRHDVDRGVRRARRRLADLDALAEVVQEEVEETALDVAARVRSFRTGAGMVSRLRRMLFRQRR